MHQDLKAHELTRITIDFSQKKKFMKGQHIFQEGDSADEVYIIKKGDVEFYKAITSEGWEKRERESWGTSINANDYWFGCLLGRPRKHNLVWSAQERLLEWRSCFTVKMSDTTVLSARIQWQLILFSEWYLSGLCTRYPTWSALWSSDQWTSWNGSSLKSQRWLNNRN